MNFLILNGPNLNLLGRREPEIYGNQSLADLENEIRTAFPKQHFTFFQSNYEGELIDILQQSSDDGIVFNPAAFTHYSIALLDAIKAIQTPVIEVHLSDISKREGFRQKSVLKEACLKQISGHGFASYHMAIEHLIDYIHD